MELEVQKYFEIKFGKRNVEMREGSFLTYYTINIPEKKLNLYRINDFVQKFNNEMEKAGKIDGVEIQETGKKLKIVFKVWRRED